MQWRRICKWHHFYHFLECDILECHYFETVIRCSEIDDWAKQSAKIWW
jgi:hypothetical protein